MLLANKQQLHRFVVSSISEAKDIFPIDSLETRPNLNRDIFDENQRVHKDVKLALLRIAKHFYNYLERELIIKDIVLTGSLANYNWSEYSDIDLHLIADLSNEKDPAAIQELMVLKSKSYNTKHDIEVKGYEVELFVEGHKTKAYTSGIYSLKYDDWVKKPKKKFKEPFNRNKLKRKTMIFINAIDRATKDKDVNELINIKETIKDYRRKSLKLYGEGGTGNLVYKLLRRMGFINKLYSKISDIEDKELSLEGEN